MTTPQTFSPNIRILPKGLPVAEGADPSETPLAELLLGDFPNVRDHYAERDVLAALENVPVIITIAARAGWAALAQDISDATESGRLLLADWWRHGWSETFQRPAFWVAPEAPPDPGAHPYPVPAPVAELEPAADVAELVASLQPLPGPKSSELPVVPPAEPEPAADEAPATDATAVLRHIAAEQEAAKEPGDATKVIAISDAEDGDSHE